MVTDDFMKDLIGGKSPPIESQNQIDIEKMVDVISTKINNEVQNKIDSITESINNLKSEVQNYGNNQNKQGINQSGNVSNDNE